MQALREHVGSQQQQREGLLEAFGRFRARIEERTCVVDQHVDRPAVRDEAVGQLVVLAPDVGVRHGAHLPRRAARVEEQVLQRGVLDAVLAAHLLHHQLGVGLDLELGHAPLGRAP